MAQAITALFPLAMVALVLSATMPQSMATTPPFTMPLSTTPPQFTMLLFTTPLLSITNLSTTPLSMLLYITMDQLPIIMHMVYKMIILVSILATRRQEMVIMLKETTMFCFLMAEPKL